MIVEIAGWLTATILLTAGVIQLTKIIRTRKAEGISSFAWLLYGIAGLGAYVFAEKYSSLQAVFTFLIPGMINLFISAVAYNYNRKKR